VPADGRREASETVRDEGDSDRVALRDDIRERVESTLRDLDIAGRDETYEARTETIIDLYTSSECTKAKTSRPMT
jgi:hypothetical protein